MDSFILFSSHFGFIESNLLSFATPSSPTLTLPTSIHSMSLDLPLTALMTHHHHLTLTPKHLHPTRWSSNSIYAQVSSTLPSHERLVCMMTINLGAVLVATHLRTLTIYSHSVLILHPSERLGPQNSTPILPRSSKPPLFLLTPVPSSSPESNHSFGIRTSGRLNVHSITWASFPLCSPLLSNTPIYTPASLRNVIPYLFGWLPKSGLWLVAPFIRTTTLSPLAPVPLLLYLPSFLTFYLLPPLILPSPSNSHSFT